MILRCTCFEDVFQALKTGPATEFDPQGLCADIQSDKYFNQQLFDHTWSSKLEEYTQQLASSPGRAHIYISIYMYSAAILRFSQTLHASHPNESPSCDPGPGTVMSIPQTGRLLYEGTLLVVGLECVLLLPPMYNESLEECWQRCASMLVVGT